MTDTIPVTTPLDEIKSLINPDLLVVESLIRDTTSHISLSNAIIDHVIQAGGKRLRPITLLLWAKHLGYSGEHHTLLAAMLELVHTATLLHDDVVDESPMRRGRPTANALWGNAASVLTGDYLYTKSFNLLSECFNPHISLAVSGATTRISEGELLQLIHRHDLTLSQEQYLHILSCKTGQLFELASVLPGHLTHQNESTLHWLRHYGMNLGLAFQLMDDVLDYTGETEMLGKRIGDDLADGNLTLPLIYALQHASPNDRTLIQQIITSKNVEALPQMRNILHECGAIAYTLEQAKHYTDYALQALTHFSDSPYLNALAGLAEFNRGRVY